MVAGGWDVWYMVGAETVLPADVIRAIPSSLYQGHWDTGIREKEHNWPEGKPKATQQESSVAVIWQVGVGH